MRGKFKNVLGAAALALTFAAGPAWPQANYPGKPVTLVLPFAPGGTVDALGRILGEKMGALLGQTFVIENVAGAGSTIGAAKVAQAAPDGYTLLFNNMSQALVSAQYPKLSFDPVESYALIGLAGYLPMWLEARTDFPAKNIKEAVEYIKKNHARMTMANGGMASSTHLCGMMILDGLGVDMTHVPYKGAGPALVDLVGGSVDMMCDSPGSSTELVKAGKLRVFAVTDKKRVPSFPDVPTFQESGYPDMQLLLWHGMFAPKGTPAPVVAKLTATLKQALADEGVRQRMAALSITPEDPAVINPEGLRERMVSETRRWSPLIKRAIGK